MSSLIPRIVVGLGNPGARYEWTRHNAGYMVLDALARELAKGNWMRECQSLVCRAEFAGAGVMLAKPLTFMNRSGDAVRDLLDKYGLSTNDALLVVDDFNLPFGRIRVRRKGSAGGHNGLESVIGALATKEFLRVRLGIGEEHMPQDKADFVLEEFPPTREEELKEMIGRAGDAVKMILSCGVSRAMSVYNC